MTLTLSVTNFEKLENGESTVLTLDRHGAVIGRSPHADWSLPDPRNYISSNHCEIEFRDGGYWLIDRSTNGTLLNGASERMSGPHPLADGDSLIIGHYRIEARLRAAQAREPEPAPDADEGGWKGWDTPKPAAPPRHEGMGFDPLPPPRAPEPPPASDWQRQAAARAGGWAAEPAGVAGHGRDDDRWSEPGAAIGGRGPMAQSFTPPPVAPSAHDVWAEFEESNRVDWGRGGFDSRWGAPDPVTTPPTPEPAPPAKSKASAEALAWAAFLAAAGLEDEDLGPTGKAAATGGALLRRLVAGLVVMLEARARAKAQLGARGTVFKPEGNNPLKFCRTPDQALAQLLAPAQRGHMPADFAVDDAFKDLQAHQMATLAAMQGALRATLDRFSPSAIRARAGRGGILPGSREAALWRAYEREFDGVVAGSDEAFLDVFAQAFREAYERSAGG